MKKIQVTLLSLLTMMVLTSCEFSFNTESNNTSSDKGSSSLSSGQLPTSQDIHTESSQEYFDFFAPTSKVAINLTISKANLKLLEDYGNQNNERQEIYHPAAIDITVNNGTSSREYRYDQVGVRLKGNTSKEYFVNNDGYIYGLVHFKVSFDEFVLNQRFLSMSKIDLKWNRNLDHTIMRQAYMYKMFQDYLDLSPSSTLTKFGITQTEGSNSQYTYLGVYNALEVVDKRMIKRVYTPSDSEGNLYKVTYNIKGPADFTMSGAVLRSGSTYSAISNGKIGIEDASRQYVPSYDLKTNKQTPNFVDMATLIGRINSTTQYSANSSKTMLDGLIDMDTYLKMEAIAFLIGNPDDLRNNYNNAYTYFIPSSGKAVFVPYDFDRGLGSHGDWDPTGNSMTTVTPYSSRSYGFWQEDKTQRNNLYRFTIMDGAHPDYRSAYRNYILEAINDGWLSNEKFEVMFNQYKSHYEFDMIPDNDLPYVHFSLNETTLLNWTFANYRSAKLNTVNTYL